MNESVAMQGALAAMRAVRLISAVTPSNAEAEMEQLLLAFERGVPRLPSWTYTKRDTTGLVENLRELSGAAEYFAEPLRSLYRERIDELRLESALVSEVGDPAFGRHATERHRQTSRAADKLASAWVHEKPADDGPSVASDAPDPRSLLSQVRAAIGAHRVPFTVRPVSGLMALAATGERTVYVARARSLSERRARRVALHEVLGHVLPRVRAARAHPIFALGTAGGTDDQEGLALLYEQRHGLLDGPRRVELARRHLATSAMRGGADFVDVVRHLRGLDPYLSLSEALHIATRTFRGSTGSFQGLGREGVYLPALLRVRACLRKSPRAERILESGQVAVNALRQLSALRAVVPPAADPQLGKQATPSPPVNTATV
jgi:hypothetical protein